MIGVLWAYEGWQYVTFSAGETRDPQRVFPRAIAVGDVRADRALSAGQRRVRRRARPDGRGGRASHVAADATAAVFGSLSGKLLSVLVLVSIFSAANGLMLTAPRLYFAMARDGVVLLAPRASERALRHAGVGDRAVAVLVGAARAHRHVRAAAHLRRLRRLDLLRPRRARACSRRDADARTRCVRSGRPAIRSRPCSSSSPRRCSSCNTLFAADRARRRSGSPSCCSELRRSSSGVRASRSANRAVLARES